MNIGFGKNYVINLKRHKERKEHALGVLGHENTIFIEGFDGQDYVGDDAWLKENLSPIVIDPHGWWTIGIICCALSHRKAWKAFLDSGEETACFFEDDVIINKAKINYDTIETIRDGLEGKKNWGCVFLGKLRNTIDLVDDKLYLPLHGETIWAGYKRFKEDQFCAHAYILNKKSAKWLYEHQLPVSKALDVYLEFMPFDIYAPRFSQFNQKRYEYALEPGYSPFLDLIKNGPEIVLSSTTTDGVPRKNRFYIGKTFPKYSSEMKAFSLPRYNAFFKGFKFRFDI
jgi:GR25 family glycosyltransferase involved in LPS biosynthesis